MNAQLPPVCILAGGLATRLGERARQIPKGLVEVAGEPFLNHQLRLLAEHGGSQIVICVGHLGEQIRERIGTEAFGLQIAYSDEGPVPVGTLGAIRHALPLLGGRFLVLYGDTYLRLDYQEASATWRRSELPAMMSVLRNAGRWDTSNASFDGTRVTRYDKRAPRAEMEWIDYGLGGLEAATLARLPPEATDVCDLYHELAASGDLFGFVATDRFYEIGTPAALAEADAFLSGRSAGLR